MQCTGYINKVLFFKYKPVDLLKDIPQRRLTALVQQFIHSNDTSTPLCSALAESTNEQFLFQEWFHWAFPHWIANAKHARGRERGMSVQLALISLYCCQWWRGLLRCVIMRIKEAPCSVPTQIALRGAKPLHVSCMK